MVAEGAMGLEIDPSEARSEARIVALLTRLEAGVDSDE